MVIRHRGVVLIGGTLVSLGFAAVFGGSLAWHLCGFLAVLCVLLGYSQLGPLSGVRVTRTVAPGPYYADGRLDVSLTVVATRWPWLHLVVTDRLQSAQGEAEFRFVLTTIGNRVQSINYRVADLSRGSLEFTDITLSTGDIFGVFERTLHVNAEVLCLQIWPKIVPLRRDEVKSSLCWEGRPLRLRRSQREITQLQGIREYVPGDRLAHVHWRTSAHTGDFKVKHFEPEDPEEFIVVLDASRYFSALDWELAVSIAASLAHAACRSQLPLRVAALDAPLGRAPSSAGGGALFKMMDFLSGLPHGGEHDEALRWGHNMLVISTRERRDAWQGVAMTFVTVGAGGVTSLSDWRTALGSMHSSERVRR